MSLGPWVVPRDGTCRAQKIQLWSENSHFHGLGPPFPARVQEGPVFLCHSRINVDPKAVLHSQSFGCWFGALPVSPTAPGVGKDNPGVGEALGEGGGGVFPVKPRPA